MLALPDACAVRPPRNGQIHRWRRRLQTAVSGLFLVAPFVDLCRFDLRHGSLILARTEFVLNELGPIFLLLLLAMLVIFAGALLYGRLWCGWMCPQTTLSELAATIERHFARGRKQLSARERTLASGVILAVSALVAASLTSYFIDPSAYFAPTLPACITFAVLFAIIAADLLWVRHGFCVGICPYGILQGVVTDEHTLGVGFDDALQAQCINCRACVRACFMGIDIRSQPFHMSCLNCGDCIDSINATQRKRKLPVVSGFRFGMAASAWPPLLARLGISDWRRAIVLSALLGLSGVTVYSLATRAPIYVRLSPQFERTTADRQGTVRNHFSLALGNRRRVPLHLHVDAAGVDGLAVEDPVSALELAPGERTRVALVLTSAAPQLAAGAHSVTVRLSWEEGSEMLVPARFFVPDRREQR